jgi:hypothetical protein
LIFEGANFKKSAFMKNREGHTKDTGSKAWDGAEVTVLMLQIKEHPETDNTDQGPWKGLPDTDNIG